jgi:hypothetical protein
MKLIFCLAVMASGLAALCFAGERSDQWPIREQETIEKTVTLSGAPMRLVIDNLDGHVHVTGTGGSQVRMTAHKIIRAETDSDLAEAKNEVKLEVTEKPGTVSIYYDAPWRCNCEGRGCPGEHRRFYSVTYDIDVEAPRAARTVISTVNDGDVRAENMDGDFDVSNINGGISMTAISGSGNVHTINGPVTIHFAKNPERPSSFKSLNGALDVYFRPGLSANLLFKTFNGEIYSDFEVTPRASTAGRTEQRDGKFIYRSNRTRGGSTGRGGPELTFDAFNGNIRLHEEK